MVDGIVRDSYNDIDPNEIDNISILKDASATAVFGVRGANGVILINNCCYFLTAGGALQAGS